jgi:hypothetical protein
MGRWMRWLISWGRLRFEMSVLWSVGGMRSVLALRVLESAKTNVVVGTTEARMGAIVSKTRRSVDTEMDGDDTPR